MSRNPRLNKNVCSNPETTARVQKLLAEKNSEAGHVVLIGSHAYNLAHAKSDVDTRGIFFLDPVRLLNGETVEDQVGDRKEDYVLYEASMVTRQYLQGKVGAVEMLHSPLVEQQSSAGRYLVEHLKPLVGTLDVMHSAKGYAWGMRSKLEKGRFASSEKALKAQRHSVRVLQNACRLLETGELNLYLDEEAKLELFEKTETLESTVKTLIELEKQLEKAGETSNLPRKAEFVKGHKVLFEARKLASNFKL